MAVLRLGKVLTGLGEGGTATVEAVGVVEGRLGRWRISLPLFVIGRKKYLLAVVVDPVRDHDGG